MTEISRSFEEEKAIRRREALLRREGANLLFGALALLASPSTHGHIYDREHDKEDN